LSALLSTAASITRWRSVSEPSVFSSDSETERRVFIERVGPQPRWLRSRPAAVIVSVSRELRRIASAAATSPARQSPFERGAGQPNALGALEGEQALMRGIVGAVLAHRPMSERALRASPAPL
jgi:hypothetical protein